VDKLSELLIRRHGERFCALWNALVAVYRAETEPFLKEYQRSNAKSQAGRSHASEKLRHQVIPYRAKLFRSIAELKKEDHDNRT